MKKIAGYSDEISVFPGGRISFMVSCDGPKSYTARIVRIIHGDTSPEGPGFKEKAVKTGIDGKYRGRKQEIYAGSHVVVPNNPHFEALSSFTVQAMIWPTTPETGRQALITRGEGARRSGFRLEIDEAGALSITLGEAAIRERQRSAVSQAIEIVRRRVDETGTREPTIQRQGEDRILLQLPGVGDPERIKRLLGQTAKMSFHLVDEATPIQDALAGRLPPGSRLMYRNDPRYEEPVPVVIRKRVAVSGENLDNAQMTFQDNRPVVSLSFDGVGGRKFGKLTTDNVGKRFAIVLDDAGISAPGIREPIPGGSGIIEGGFTVETATDLALLLRAGALPAPLIILEERTVGPSLGADSIAAGKIASIIGLCLVVAYMIMSYGLFGIAATLALAFSTFFHVRIRSAASRLRSVLVRSRPAVRTMKPYSSETLRLSAMSAGSGLSAFSLIESARL